MTCSAPSTSGRGKRATKQRTPRNDDDDKNEGKKKKKRTRRKVDIGGSFGKKRSSKSRRIERESISVDT